MTPRDAADLIADLVWTWSKEAGSPLVLTREDREAIEKVIGGLDERIPAPDKNATLDAFYAALPVFACSFCGNKSKHHDIVTCRDRWLAEMRSLKSAGRV